MVPVKAMAATDDKLKQLENDLDQLKSLYEQYFNGLVKLQPIREHENWQRAIRSVSLTELTSTSQKFRFTNLKARYQQLNTSWLKICKQIEEGCFIREKNLNYLRTANQDAPPKEKAQHNDSTSKALADINGKEQQALEALYKKLKEKVGKKKMMEEKAFFQTMSKQIEKFKSKNPGKSFQFKVAKDAKNHLKVKIEAKK